MSSDDFFSAVAKTMYKGKALWLLAWEKKTSKKEAALIVEVKYLLQEKRKE